VVEETGFPSAGKTTAPAQMRQMKGRRGRRHSQSLTNGTGVNAGRSGFDEQTEDGQTGFVTEGRKKFGCV